MRAIIGYSELDQYNIEKTHGI